VSEEKQKQLDKKRAKLAETDSGIAEMEGRRRAAIKERGQLEVQLKKLANARTRIDKDLAEARNKCVVHA
jgi:septal ring factor EnvC (AmiA/AmiB activator)